MKQSISWIKDKNNYWTVVIGNQSYQFNESHPSYNTLVQAVKDNNADLIVSEFSVVQKLTEWCEGDFKIEAGVLYYKDEEVNNCIADRILEMMKEGFDYKPMLLFLQNLYQNPSYRAITELYGFLSHKFLPITSDGHFLAYKAVRSDFKDKHTGTIDNSVGSKPSMDRNKVDDNANKGCSKGLHIGTIEYVREFADRLAGDKLLICKVNPRDVVSVPLDHSEQKVRCCLYEVVALFEDVLTRPVHKEYDSFADEYSDEYEDDYEDEYDDEEDYLDDDEDRDHF